MLLIQIAGGLFGLAVSYAIHRLFEIPYERSTAEARAKHLAEMEEIRKKQQLLRNKK